MNRFEGKKILVTGAATGIGAGIAKRFAAEGGSVAVNYVANPEQAAMVGAEVLEACMASGATGCEDLVIQADVSHEDSVAEMFRKVLEKWGRIDVVINNAGIQKPTPSHELEAKDFDRVLDVNLRGAWLCSRAAIRHFLSRPGGGVIINNSSVHQIIPKPKYLSYSISKGGMANLTRTLALEYADRGIRVNAVAPGAIVTPINQAWIGDAQAKSAVESHIPMGRAGTVEEIAGVVAFLASADASYVTGQTLYACGGLTLYPEFRSAWSSGE